MSTHLTLHILSTRQQVPLEIKGKTILGRAGGVDNEGTLHIDLSPFLAYNLGVSRRHVLFVPENNQVLAFDLSSRNGTYINDELMSPRKGYPIQDGDELRLGSLEIRLYFTSEVPYAHIQTRQLPPLEEAIAKPAMPSPKPDIRETLTTTRPLSFDTLEALEEPVEVDEDSHV